MRHDIHSVVVKRERGKLTVQGLGRTERGTKYIKANKPLKVESMADPAFKSQLKTAVDEMLAQESLPL